MIKYLILAIAIGFIACSSGKTEIENPVSEEIMTRILFDFYFLEAHFNDLNSQIKDSIMQAKFKEILIKYNITKTDFIQAQKYYNSNPAALIRIENGIKSTIKDSTLN